VLIHRAIGHLGLRLDIRHFKNEAECTLTGAQQCIADVEFHNPNLDVMLFVEWVGNREGQKPRGAELLMNSFIRFSRLLGKAGSSEKAGKSSLFSGGWITLRFFTLSKGDQAPWPEDDALFASLADQ
jgi:hypothetical protein